MSTFQVSCRNTGGYDLIIDRIDYVSQIYRFDTFVVEILTGNRSYEFEIPLAEWLAKFTNLIKANYSGCYEEILIASGHRAKFWFYDDKIDIFEYDILTDNIEDISISREFIPEFHSVLLASLVEPYVAQGGNLDNLKDYDEISL
jgi:hypothetical protein